ncbi:MAG: hypothetical protein JHC23_01795 [Sulfolobus sp.]|nr:hypothetical protein [Sulfolobus sp.]
MSSNINLRVLSWNVASAIGYSFVLTIVTFIVSVIVKAFYPPSIIGAAPLLDLFMSPAVGIVQLVVLGLMLAFTWPITAVRNELKNARSVALYTTVGYLFFSLLPYAFPGVVTDYPQTFLGLLIASNILNGALAGALAYKLNV